MTTNKFYLISLALVFVGYVTLTLTLPLLPTIAHQNPALSDSVKHYLVVMFCSFAVSAVLFNGAADLIGPLRILMPTQLLSFTGLMVFSLAQSQNSIVFGYLLIGLGTGCYSGIARKILAEKSENSAQQQRAFAVFSLITAFAPLLTTQMAAHLPGGHWRWCYWLIAALEAMLMLSVYVVLKNERRPSTKLTLGNMTAGYLYCLKQPMYRLNMIAVGLVLACYIRAIIGNSHLFFIAYLGNDKTGLMLLSTSLSIAYCLGILTCKSQAGKRSSRTIDQVMLLLLLGSGVGYFIATGYLLKCCLMTLACMALGYHVPRCCSAGINNLDGHFGAASALFTCSFSLCSALISWIHNAYAQIPLDSFIGYVWLSTTALLWYSHKAKAI